MSTCILQMVYGCQIWSLLSSLLTNLSFFSPGSLCLSCLEVYWNSSSSFMNSFSCAYSSDVFSGSGISGGISSSGGSGPASDSGLLFLLISCVGSSSYGLSG